MIIAVDFDGTVVDHRFPDVGPDVPGAVNCLQDLVARGHKIILWTMRSGIYLAHAVEWYAERGIPLFGVNENPEQKSWTKSPKAYAQVYVDDAAVGCPLIIYAKFKRPCVNWESVMENMRFHDAGPQGGHNDAPPLPSNPSDQRAGASPAPLYQVVGQTADDRLSYVDAELRKWYGDDPAPIEHIARSVKKHCDDLSARLDAVRDELEDWKDAARAAASGGHPDEVHCTCVPLLQKSLKDCKREREELLAIADRTREQLAARVRYLEREMGDLDQEMEWLQGDIEGQAQQDRIVLYHHNCMSGTDCDACRVMGRIRDIRARLCLPNPTDHGARSAPVHPVVGRISESGEKP